jgi:ABC-2 type transport system ATP-binding protein
MSDDFAIRMTRLTKDYGHGHGLFDLDLDVQRGEILGFLGPNGAGKSTTMRLLLDLIKPTSGSATMLGLDSQADSLEIRRRVGFLPGELALYPMLSGAAMLDYLAELRGGVDRGFATRSQSGSTPSSAGGYASCRRATVRSSA